MTELKKKLERIRKGLVEKQDDVADDISYVVHRISVAYDMADDIVYDLETIEAKIPVEPEYRDYRVAVQKAKNLVSEARRLFDEAKRVLEKYA